MAINFNLFIFLQVIVLTTFVASSSIASSNSLVEQALKLNLDNHSQWHKLLFYDSLSQKSEVLTKEFFISPLGFSSPKDELVLTIEAYLSQDVENLSEHIQCKFPARYLWLSQYIDLPNYSFRNASCRKLEEWAKFDEVTSISAVMVSGYFGNPASTFGHSLLKFNSEVSSKYLDLTFNYGALVPENEHILLYVYRGLLGKYESGFSDGYYYSQDMVYSHTEFRDMWDYELNLSEFEKNLIISHLWEVSGKKFKYYFLTKNCAFKIAEVLSLIDGAESLTKGASYWYAPVELFHKLENIKVNNNFIRNVDFIPSSERVLHNYINQLNSEEFNAFKGSTKTHKIDLDLDTSSQIKVLNSLISYYEFKNIESRGVRDNTYKELKRVALAKRLQLPPSKEPKPIIPVLPSPLDSSPPMKLSFGLKHSVSNNKNSLDLSWSPFYYSSTSLNSLDGGELIVLDTHINITEHKAKFSSVDLIKVRKMPSYNKLSSWLSDIPWSVEFSLRPSSNNDLSPEFTGGVFNSHRYSEFHFLYGANLHLSDNKPSYIFVEPYLAFYLSGEKSKLWAQLSESYDIKYSSYQTKALVKVSGFFTKRHSVVFEFSNTLNKSFSLSYQYFM